MTNIVALKAINAERWHCCEIAPKRLSEVMATAKRLSAPIQIEGISAPDRARALVGVSRQNSGLKNMKSRIIGWISAVLIGVALASAANAQGVTRICTQSIGANGSNNCVDIGATNPLPSTISGAGGVTATVSLDGALSVNTPPNPEFTDLFSAALDTATNWTTNNSGGTTATSSGSLVISGTTTLSQYGGLSTKQSWTPAGISPQIFGVVAVYNTLAVTNSVRTFGVYTSPGTPTLAAPITDGYVFRLDATGALFAEVWAAGVAVASSNITAVTGCAPTAGLPNLYYVSFRTNLVQFGCGNNPSAFITFINPANQTLPISAYSIAGLSNPGSAATMTLTGLSLSSQSGGAVKSAGQAPTVNDPYYVVGGSPNAPFVSVSANVTAALSGMSSNNAATQIALQGTNSVSVLLSGTWVGTLTPQVSADSGTTWANTQFFNPATQAYSSTVTANGTYDIFGTGGKTHARVLLSPYTSGTVTGNLSATSQAPSDAAAIFGLSLQVGTAGSPATQVVSVQGVSGGTPVPTQGPSTGGGFPTASTPTTNSATGTTGATTATLAAVSAKFTYLCGFTITSDATAALAGTATVTGVIGGTLSFIQNVGSATAAGILTQRFSPCLQSSAVNTAIVVNSVAAGTGGNTAVTADGYQQ